MEEEMILNVDSVMKLEKKGEIFYQLETIGKYIDDNLKDIDKVECTEENKKEIKNRRTNVNNTLKEFEDKRKALKTAYMENYNIFEEKYKEEIKSKLENASIILSMAIFEIETQQLDKKEENLKKFFDEYQKAYHLENLVSFKDMNLKILLSKSESSYKDEICKFCQKIASEINVIIQEEDSKEILNEYKQNGFDFVGAKSIVIERKKRLQSIQEQLENKEKLEKQESTIIENVETLVSNPVEISDCDEEEYECTFTIVVDRMEKIELVKNFLKENNIKFKN